MDFLQLQYFQFTKTGFSPFENFKNVSEDFLVTQKSGFYKFSDNPGHKYLRLVHILNEFCFHHKQSKGISNDIQSSWWNFIYIFKRLRT